METFAKVLNKNLNVQKDPNQDELRAHIQSNMDKLERAFAQLERPEFAEYIKFAVLWERVGHELSALRSTLRERIAQKQVNPINEFLKKLKKN
jgi:hypothetical protein